MNSVQEKQKMRKKNMKLFPIYKAFAWDFLFFYTIDFLFLTQIKGIEASNVVLKSTFYSFKFVTRIKIVICSHWCNSCNWKYN